MWFTMKQMNPSQKTKYYTTNQSRFKINHSTILCPSSLTDKILKGFDEGGPNGIILTDLQKAFETINHKILINKLEVTGIISWACLV